jgi:catechol 2,3-dioxygenase-like lactoylglutathione lyase family enzyme
MEIGVEDKEGALRDYGVPPGLLGIRCLSHIGITVNDLRTSVEFYEDVLGFGRQYEYENASQGWTRIGLSIGDFLVELFSPRPESKAGVEIDPFYPMSWGRPKIALTVSNVEAAYSRVVAAQIPVLCPIVLTSVSKSRSSRLAGVAERAEPHACVR